MQLNSEHLSHLDEGVQQAIYKILRNEPTTTTLDLSGMKIGDKEAQALGTALQTNNTLTTLTLRCNMIGDKGAYALAKVKVTFVIDKLKFHSYLYSLELILWIVRL